MQPFNAKTVYAILLAVCIYTFCYILFNSIPGWIGIVTRTITFSAFFGLSIFYWKITPDADQLLSNFKQRMNK
jgi:hypothetical protein